MPPKLPITSQPSTHTWRVFCTTLGNAWICCSLYSPGRLHQTFDGQCPTVEIDFGIEHVVVVVRKALERSDFVVAEGLRQAMTPEQLAGSPIAEDQSVHQQRLLQLGNGKCAEGDNGTSFRQFAAIDTLTLARGHIAHFFACGARTS